MRKESLEGLSALTGFDRRTIKPRLKDLTPIKGPRGAHLYETREALPLLYSRDGSVYDIEQERARLLYHQANLAELDEDVKTGTLIPAETVFERWSAVVVSVRAKLLSMPSQLAGKCANMTQAEIEIIAGQLVRQALEELQAGSDRSDT